MSLPLAERIRTLRAAVARAERAALDLGEVRAALSGLATIARRPLAQDDPAMPLPGEDLPRLLPERWPELGPLPSPTGDLPRRLVTLRALLEGVAAHLAPLADTLLDGARELHELQHEQQERLRSPEFAGDRTRVDALVSQRDALATSLVPLEQRLGIWRPIPALIDGWLARARSDLQGGRPAQVQAWVEQVGDQLRSIDRIAPLPAPEVVTPPSDDPAALEAALESLAGTRRAIAKVLVSLEAEHRALQTQREALDDQLLAQLG